MSTLWIHRDNHHCPGTVEIHLFSRIMNQKPGKVYTIISESLIFFEKLLIKMKSPN
jgi:hypothetical protein